jgi:hypothetical protein
MPAYVSDNVLDQGVKYVDDNCDALYICSAQPTTYAEATSTYALGTKASPTIGAPENGASTGRRVIVSAITDGTVSGTDDATHFALVKTGTSELLVAQALNAPQAVTSGNTFTLTSFSITIPDPA